MGKIPSPLALTPTLHTSTLIRPSTTTTPFSSCLQNQIRLATFIHRPRRPYTFTQLVQLSDGSTYTVRTTSPQPLYRATKDTRNTLTWQPSEKSLRNVELDEAGKLAAFRERFGRAFDSQAQGEGEDGAPASQDDAQTGGDVFSDLMSAYAPEDSGAMKDAGAKKAPTKRK